MENKDCVAYQDTVRYYLKPEMSEFEDEKKDSTSRQVSNETNKDVQFAKHVQRPCPNSVVGIEVQELSRLGRSLFLRSLMTSRRERETEGVSQTGTQKAPKEDKFLMSSSVLFDAPTRQIGPEYENHARERDATETKRRSSERSLDR